MFLLNVAEWWETNGDIIWRACTTLWAPLQWQVYIVSLEREGSGMGFSSRRPSHSCALWLSKLVLPKTTDFEEFHGLGDYHFCIAWDLQEVFWNIQVLFWGIESLHIIWSPAFLCVTWITFFLTRFIADDPGMVSNVNLMWRHAFDFYCIYRWFFFDVWAHVLNAFVLPHSHTYILT